MDIAKMTGDLSFQLIGMTDDNGEDLKVFSLDDLGEIFIKTPNGQFFKLAIDEITSEDANFIDDDDWSFCGGLQRSALPSAPIWKEQKMTELSLRDFTDRFKARMLECVPEQAKAETAEYAETIASSYYESGRDFRESPEECADNDMSYWGEG